MQDGVLEAIGEIVDRMAELRTMAADVSKNAADVENYSEFLELQDQLTQMKQEKFNGVELFAVENEQDTMKGINKSHLVVNGELHDNVNGKTCANKAEYDTLMIQWWTEGPRAPLTSTNSSCHPPHWRSRR